MEAKGGEIVRQQRELQALRVRNYKLALLLVTVATGPIQKDKQLAVVRRLLVSLTVG